ncbi:hypothetical protein SPLC1_S532850 [Arthrospira platensis C1]|nr:hypothetical protein SPLC1_S532850 [Arthrospira platensis C1]
MTSSPGFRIGKETRFGWGKLGYAALHPTYILGEVGLRCASPNLLKRTGNPKTAAEVEEV